MSMRTMLLLLVAVAVAGMTAFSARSWIMAERAAMQARSAPAPAAPATKEILVATVGLATGAFVKESHLKWQAWPVAAIAEGYLVKGEGDAGPAGLRGAVVRTAIAAGQPLTAAKVVQPGERGFLAAVLTPGTRAVSVPVNATTGISGFVFPGDRVDVVHTMRLRARDAEGEGETRHAGQTLLTGVRVLAIDQSVEKTNGEPSIAKTATIEVTPKQAEIVALGLEMGAFTLSLQSLRESGAEGAEPDRAPGAVSYTIDEDVMAMRERLFGRTKGASRSINVLRGNKSDVASF